MAYNAGSQSGNLVLIQSQIVSGSSAITFTSGVTGFDNYQLNFYGITVSSNGAVLGVQLSTNGGSSYSATGYNQNGYQVNSGTLGAFSVSAQASWFLHQGQDNTSTASIEGQIIFFNFANASLNKTSIVNSSYINTAVTGLLGCGGNWTTATAVNALKILPSAGTFSGTFKLYGVQN